MPSLWPRCCPRGQPAPPLLSLLASLNTSMNLTTRFLEANTNRSQEVQGIIPPTRLAAEFHFAARSHIDDVTAKDELFVS